MDIIAFNEASTANGRIESFIENPDSTSGIVTVPKVIASGENITIPAGRVAVLPNVVVDGTLNIDGEVFIPSGSTFGDLDAQIALKADTSYVNTQLGLKANTVDLKEIGVGQTWQNVTGSRALGTTYTNTTGKPIMVIIHCRASTAADLIAYVDSNQIAWQIIPGTGMDYCVYFIVTNGSSYSISTLNLQLQKWSELR